MDSLRKGWAWIVDHAAALLGGLVVIVSAIWMWRSKQNEVNRLRDAIQVKDAERKVAVATTKKQAAIDRMDVLAVEATQQHAKLREHKKRIVEIRTREPIVQELSDEDLDRRLSDLGY